LVPLVSWWLTDLCGLLAVSFAGFRHYNNPMFIRIFLLLLLTFLGASFFSKAEAQAYYQNSSSSSKDVDDEAVTGGFDKPYEYERQAYGYDPEGVQYKENQAEDFQVIFISALPFTAGASFLITSTISLVAANNFGVGGDFFLPFLASTVVGATTIACVSTLTNPYPPPASGSYVDSRPGGRPLAFNVPIITAKF
jgi:hypothetical protein